ncbi:MAG: hypothetical protein OYK82_05780 [Gammaproteobacteria bacterium]|nr:hypothetical protein [Gammaproteobacteria bacterium]
MAEIGRLLVEYPEKDWQALVDCLRDRALVEEIATAIDQARVLAAQSAEKTKTRVARPRSNVLARVAREDRKKAEILSAFRSRLTDQGQDVTLAYIRGFASSLGMKEELANRKEQAANQVIRYLAAKTTDEIERVLRKAVPVQRPPGHEFDRWVDLILGADASKGRQAYAGKPVGVSTRTVDAAQSAARIQEETGRVTHRFGIPEDTWNTAKNAACREMSRAARREDQISYSDLAQHICRTTGLCFEPYDPRYHEMLGEISKAEDAAGRGMLSVVVVHKDDDGLPGPGFFKLASRLGRTWRSKVDFWIEESKRVYAVWERRPESD